MSSELLTDSQAESMFCQCCCCRGGVVQVPTPVGNMTGAARSSALHEPDCTVCSAVANRQVGKGQALEQRKGLSSAGLDGTGEHAGGRMVHTVATIAVWCSSIMAVEKQEIISWTRNQSKKQKRVISTHLPHSLAL